MSELSGPADHSLMRVSDSDREQAADVLREAAGQGRISLDELEVDVSGVAFMGGFDHNASGPGVPGAPQVRVLGFALMGGVEVRRRPLKKVRRDAIEDARPANRELDQP